MERFLNNLNISLEKKENLPLLTSIGIVSIGIPILVRYMFIGAVHSPFSFIFGKPKYIIKGYISSGYEEVNKVIIVIYNN